MANVYYKTQDDDYILFANSALEGYTEGTGGTQVATNRTVIFETDSEDKFYLPSNCSYLFSGINNTELNVNFVGSITNASYMFNEAKCVTINIPDTVDFSNCTNTASMFRGNEQLTTLNGNDPDLSAVTNMNGMFYNCSELKSIPTLTTRAVTTMATMFRGCFKLETLNTEHFYTGNVTTMNSMFVNCRMLKQIDLSNWDVSKVTDMSYMFNGCGVEALDLSAWNTSSLTAMASMFNNCSELATLNISNFNTSQVQGLNSTFRSCVKLEELDLSSFDTSSITSTQNTFYECTGLKTIKVGSGWDLTNTDYSTGMFFKCNSLEGEQGTAYNSSNPQDKTYAHIDGGTSNPGYLSRGGWLEHEVWIKEDGVWSKVDIYV